ncbi:MAG: hypothetical protein AAF366_04495 [Pseudomonadota bacterium]
MRRFYEWLDKHPRVEAFLELAFGLFLTFSPFAGGALLSQMSASSLDGSRFWEDFISYFNGGEITLVIFATIGGLLWLCLVKFPQTSILVKFITLIVALILVFLIGGVVSGNLGFESVLPEWILSSLFVVYLVVLAIYSWLVLVYAGRSKRRSSSEAAEAILKRARQRYHD